MGASGRGLKRAVMARNRVYVTDLPKRCRSFWLDSGAHSLYNEHILGNKAPNRFAWYADTDGKFTKPFKRYLDRYARFVKEHKAGIDYYANVDVIYSPELSWQALKYLEEVHGLNPVPVIHRGTALKWVEKHLAAGYTYVGLGGLGQESTKQDYYKWADQVYDLICPRPSRLPTVRVHGFALTSYDLMIRYPWWSVDSVSWAKAAAFACVFVPHYRKGAFTFEETPYIVTFTDHKNRGHSKKVTGTNFALLHKAEQKVVLTWLDKIGLKVGSTDDNGEMVEYGVLSSYNARAVANLKFFEAMIEWLPKWPWAFKINPVKGFFPM